MREPKLFDMQDVVNAANMVILLIQENEKQQEELTRLKEVNREMMETFQRIYDLSWDRWNADKVRECCKEMIVKAGRGVKGNETV